MDSQSEFLTWLLHCKLGLPCLLDPDPAGLKKALVGWSDRAAQTDRYIDLMETHISLGGNPIEGRTGKANGPRGEGWIVNPSCHAMCLPYNVRFLDHFDLTYPEQEYHDAMLKFADYSLELLGGKRSLPRLRNEQICRVLEAKCRDALAKYAAQAELQ